METLFNPAFPRLENNKVYLFYADVKTFRTLDKTKYMSWFDKSELSRLSTFYFEKDKTLFLVSHSLLRLVLAHYTQTHPKDIEFKFNDYGKPFLKNHPQISFNLSHSSGVAVLAVTKHRAIGVDIEKIDHEKDILPILDNFFHSSEVSQFNALGQAQQSLLFFKLWTLKEAFIKARGRGLSIALDSFHFDLSKAPLLSITFEPSHKQQSNQWYFSLLNLEKFKHMYTSVAVELDENSSHCLFIESFVINLNMASISPIS